MATEYESVEDLADALRRAAEAHGKHEERTGEADADWPDWYALYMVRERAGDELTGDFIVDPELPLAERLAANTDRAIAHAERASDAWLVWRHARSAAEPEIQAVRDRYRDALVKGMALNHLGTADPPPLARVALGAYLDFHQTALDEFTLERETGLRLLGDES